MKRWEIFLLATVVVLVAGWWWLFGYWTIETRFGTGRVYRFFGRVVRMDFDSDFDGRIDESFFYTWDVPGVHHNEPRLIVSDRNHDGQFDLWTYPQGVDGHGYAIARFEVDTDRDSRPDWTFVARREEEVYERIRARRGF